MIDLDVKKLKFAKPDKGTGYPKGVPMMCFHCKTGTTSHLIASVPFKKNGKDAMFDITVCDRKCEKGLKDDPLSWRFIQEIARKATANQIPELPGFLRGH